MLPYDEYLELLRAYLIGSMMSVDFQHAYLEKFKSENRTMDQKLFEELDALFADIDAFCQDPVLLAELKQIQPDDWYLDEQALHQRVANTVERIEKLKADGQMR